MSADDRASVCVDVPARITMFFALLACWCPFSGQTTQVKLRILQIISWILVQFLLSSRLHRIYTDRRCLSCACTNELVEETDYRIGLLRIMGPGVPTWAQVNEAMDGRGSQNKLVRLVRLWRGCSMPSSQEHGLCQLFFTIIGILARV